MSLSSGERFGGVGAQIDLGLLVPKSLKANMQVQQVIRRRSSVSLFITRGLNCNKDILLQWVLVRTCLEHYIHLCPLLRIYLAMKKRSEDSWVE